MVLELVAKVCPQEESPDTSLPLMELGIDSLAGIELGSLLLRQFPELGLPVPVLLIYELPTMDAIVDRIWKALPQLAISAAIQLPKAPTLTQISRDDDSRVAVIGLALRCVGPDSDITTPAQLWEVLKKQGCISARTLKERGWSAGSSGYRFCVSRYLRTICRWVLAGCREFRRCFFQHQPKCGSAHGPTTALFADSGL